MRWFRTQEGLIARQLGRDDFQVGGITKWQRFENTATIASGAITQWEMNNLVIGNFYEINIVAFLVHTSSGSNFKGGSIIPTHGGTTLAQRRFGANPTTDNMDQYVHATWSFFATTTDVTWNYSGSNLSFWSGSYAILKEIGGVFRTSEFSP